MRPSEPAGLRQPSPRGDDQRYAREPAGISSTAAIDTQISIARANGRATACDAASQGSEGVTAPVAVTRQPMAAAPTIIRRRPSRSAAAAASTRATTPPNRAATPATPCAPAPAPNSRPAKAMDDVSRAARYPPITAAAASSDRAFAPCASTRWGGAHHGIPRAPRTSARRTGQANSQPTNGRSSRYSTVWVTRRRSPSSGSTSTQRRYPWSGPSTASNRPGATARSSIRPSRRCRKGSASVSDPTSTEVTTRLTSEDVRAPRRQVGGEHRVGPANRAVGALGQPPGLGQDARPDRAEVDGGELARTEDQVGFGLAGATGRFVGRALELPSAGVPVAELVLQLEDQPSLPTVRPPCEGPLHVDDPQPSPVPHPEAESAGIQQHRQERLVDGPL